MAGQAAQRIGQECPSLQGRRYLVYRSSATNAVKGGFASAIEQIYRRDLVKGKLMLVSRTSARIGNDGSFDPSISKDGRRVFFRSKATNLVPGGDTNKPVADILRRGPY
jgi:hypothetical protein